MALTCTSTVYREYVDGGTNKGGKNWGHLKVYKIKTEWTISSRGGYVF